VLTGQDWLDAYYHEFPREAPYGGPKDEEFKTNAFTTTRPPKNVIVLNKDKGNPGTTIHEGMHLYQNNALMSELGSPLNEGITEFFTRKVTTPMMIARGNYEDNYQAAVVLQQAVAKARSPKRILTARSVHSKRPSSASGWAKATRSLPPMASGRRSSRISGRRTSTRQRTCASEWTHR